MICHARALQDENSIAEQFSATTWECGVGLLNASQSSYILARWSMSPVGVYTTFDKEWPSLGMLWESWTRMCGPRGYWTSILGCIMHAFCQSSYMAVKRGPLRSPRRGRYMLWISGAWEGSITLNGMILSQMRKSRGEPSSCRWPQLWGGSTWASLVM